MTLIASKTLVFDGLTDQTGKPASSAPSGGANRILNIPVGSTVRRVTLEVTDALLDRDGRGLTSVAIGVGDEPCRNSGEVLPLTAVADLTVGIVRNVRIANPGAGPLTLSVFGSEDVIAGTIVLECHDD